MDELRSEIRAAFEKEQAGLAPAAALRRNLVDAVAAQQRPRRNFQWVAVAAAVLLAVLIVAGLLSTRLLARHANVTSPHVTPSPLADYGPPPAGMNLLYFHDPNHPGWLTGYDWSGQPRATVKPDPAGNYLSGNLMMAPDGQSFVVGDTGEFRDRFGQPIPGSGAVSLSNFPASGIWADDNVHMCGMSFDTNALTYSLNTVAPGEAVKTVTVPAPAGTSLADTTANQSGNQFILTSCSFRNDRAIFYRGNYNRAPLYDASVVEVWVVKVSDGKLVSRDTYAPGSVGGVAGSVDATLIAENSLRAFFGQDGTPAPKTTIRRVSDGSVIATLDPSVAVLAFSSDNSLVLTTTWLTPIDSGAQYSPVHYAVIELQSGRTIWSYNGPDEPARLGIAEPGGNSFAVLIRAVDTRSDVVIVHGDGTSTQLPGRYEPTW
jgi:hypothetical protein